MSPSFGVIGAHCRAGSDVGDLGAIDSCRCAGFDVIGVGAADARFGADFHIDTWDLDSGTHASAAYTLPTQ